MRHVPWIRSLEFEASTPLREKTLPVAFGRLAWELYPSLPLGTRTIPSNVPIFSTIKTCYLFVLAVPSSMIYLTILSTSLRFKKIISHTSTSKLAGGGFLNIVTMTRLVG